MNPRVGAAAKRAMDKAATLRPLARAWTHGDGRVWSVVSASTGEVYQVYRYTVQPQYEAAWWERTFCTCAAAEAGLAVCWHKALVQLLRNEGIASIGG